MESGRFRGMKVTLDDSVCVSLFNQQTWELRVPLKISCMCAFVCALSFFRGDSTMWSRWSTRQIQPSHTHTQSPASKYTQCSQGHAFVLLVYVCDSSACQNWPEMISFSLFGKNLVLLVRPNCFWSCASSFCQKNCTFTKKKQHWDVVYTPPTVQKIQSLKLKAYQLKKILYIEYFPSFLHHSFRLR